MKPEDQNHLVNLTEPTNWPESLSSVAQHPIAWLRFDGMKAMPADEKDAWIEAGQPDIAADYSIPLYLSAPKLPEGFRLLPEEATDAMTDADWDVTMSEAHSNGGVSAAAWRAMVEAAPQVTHGNGHSGVGWYMHDTEYPEEGAVFLGDPERDEADERFSGENEVRSQVNKEGISSGVLTPGNSNGVPLPAADYLAKVEADPKRAAALQRARERAAGVALPAEPNNNGGA